MPKRTRDAQSLCDYLLVGDERAFLDGLLSDFDELPDGAWQAACCSAIELCGAFKGFDAHEVWLAWCIEQGEELQRATRSTT